jgi:hypothetical protein
LKANRKKDPEKKTPLSPRRPLPIHNQYHTALAEMARQPVLVELAELVEETQVQTPAQEVRMVDGVSDEFQLSAGLRSLRCQMSILK